MRRRSVYSRGDDASVSAALVSEEGGGSGDRGGGGGGGIIQAWCRMVVGLSGMDLGEDRRWFAVWHALCHLARWRGSYPTSNRSVYQCGCGRLSRSVEREEQE